MAVVIEDMYVFDTELFYRIVLEEGEKRVKVCTVVRNPLFAAIYMEPTFHVNSWVWSPTFKGASYFYNGFMAYIQMYTDGRFKVIPENTEVIIRSYEIDDGEYLHHTAHSNMIGGCQ